MSTTSGVSYRQFYRGDQGRLRDFRTFLEHRCRLPLFIFIPESMPCLVKSSYTESLEKLVGFLLGIIILDLRTVTGADLSRLKTGSGTGPPPQTRQ